MQVYIAQTRTKRLNALFESLGWGALHCRGRVDRPRVSRWVLDNGAYVDWKRGREFDSEQFERDLVYIERFASPDFVILPDLVARGLESLRFSMDWLERFPREDWYLAVQNGMTVDDVPWSCGIRGIFVGGDNRWKWDTTPMWVEAASARGLPVHVGRVSTPKKLLLARRMGVSSIDTSQPLWSRRMMDEFVLAWQQPSLPMMAPLPAYGGRKMVDAFVKKKEEPRQQGLFDRKEALRG